MMEQFAFERIMIIDDRKIDRYIAASVIKKNAFAEEIIEFDLATKALTYLQENQAHPDKLPQIILLDINMPQMNGFEFLEKLAELPGHMEKLCCVVMLTTSLSTSDHDRAAALPSVKRFINKPLNKESLNSIRQAYSV
jgi:CheY-like chemotaxis protein